MLIPCLEDEIVTVMIKEEPRDKALDNGEFEGISLYIFLSNLSPDIIQLYTNLRTLFQSVLETCFVLRDSCK